MKNAKKTLSVLLALLLVVALIPASAFAGSVKRTELFAAENAKQRKDGFVPVPYTAAENSTKGEPVRAGGSYVVSGIPENLEVEVDGVVVVPENGEITVQAGSTVVFYPAKEYKIRSFDADLASAEGDPVITLTAGDIWGDGSGYQMLLDADADTYGWVIPTDGGMPSGYDDEGVAIFGDIPDEIYAEFEYKIPKNADGKLDTENIVMNDSVSITVPAGTYDWCITNPTAGDKMWIASSNGNVPGRYNDFVFKEGHSYEFAIDVVGTNDGVFLTENGGVEYDFDEEGNPYFVMPEDGVVISCVVTVITEYFFWDFEDMTPLEDWILYDADGDGYGWNLANYGESAVSPTTVLYSQSYINYVGAVEPDNWIISGRVTVPTKDAKFSFYMSDVGYEETVGVYISTDQLDLDSYVQLGSDFTTTSEWVKQELDLSAYAGQQIYFAFRHYNSYDGYYLLIDDVEVSGENEEPPVGDDITVVVPSTYNLPEGTYTVSGNTVTVNSETAVKVGYPNNTMDGYIAITPSKVDDDTYTFTAPEGITTVYLVLAGDADLNGKISNADATKIKSYLKETATFDNLQFFAADVDGNNKISNADATKIKSALKAGTGVPW